MSFLGLESSGHVLLESSGGLLLEVPPEQQGWRPRYPDQVWPRTSLQTAGQRTFVVNVLPIPNAPPPTDYPLQPLMPSQIAPRIGQQAPRQLFRTSLVPPPVSDLRWLPILPVTIDRRRLFPAQMPSGSSRDPGSYLAVPFKHWQPIYPDPVRVLPRPTGGVPAWQVDGGTILGAADCLRWTAETLTAPTLTAEVLGQPTFTAEVLIQPTLTGEALCN